MLYPLSHIDVIIRFISERGENMDDWKTREKAEYFVNTYSDIILRICITYSLSKEDAFDMHERRVKSLQRMRQEVKDGTRHRGEFTKDGKKQEASLRQTINGTTYHVDRKDVKTEVVDGKEKYAKNKLGKYVLKGRDGGR